MTKHQALVKIQKYCAYQERCHQEVTNKLYSWGLYSDDVNEVISELISDNFLNEERFATAFVSGKFNIKNWGKVKITHALKTKGVSEYSIRKGLEQIEDNEYLKVLQKVQLKRGQKEKETNQFLRNQKIASYLVSRGFEPDLVWELINNI